ncbi:coagulation factor IIIa [Morone saxatilis]|uniref:coagulation factor IIIa n=1 Tax=Morone saxatilis TaxID=34816 RepID=UPI0015E2112E|nr:coagulation factor IIIa [Morone saxatilis]
MVTLRLRTALLAVCFLCARSVSGSYPQAQNVTWKSTNFKTLLTWEPKPSAEYSYTVEFSTISGNEKRNPHCIRSSATVCDLTSSLTSDLADLKACYTADILSEPPLGITSEDIEAPHSSSPRFCPYKDTDIGKPDFKLEVSEDKKKTTLYVTDPLTALFKDDQQLTIRDIFSSELEYKVTYRKNRSTGKKVYNSKTSTIELTNLDRGESYCFNVQAYIPSRNPDKQLGELSLTQCSTDDNKSILEEFSVGSIAAAIFFILLMIGLIIAVTVVCCRRVKKAQRRGKQVPLQDA